MNKIFEKLLNGIFHIFRYSYYRKKYNLDKNFRFNGYFIKINGNGNIKVGKNSYISFFSHINLGNNSNLIIGDNVSIAHNTRIYTISFDTKEFITNKLKKDYEKDVIIGNNVLIGTNSFINPGVTIGSNVVIGANSVITKDIPSNCVVGGIPAKILKQY